MINKAQLYEAIYGLENRLPEYSVRLWLQDKTHFTPYFSQKIYA